MKYGISRLVVIVLAAVIVLFAVFTGFKSSLPQFFNVTILIIFLGIFVMLLSYIYKTFTNK